MRAADALFELLKKHVDTVFFVPGGGAMYLVDALGQSGLRHISMTHEQGAGVAACSYAGIKGLGVCLVTSGPGATNAITACAAAWMDSVPMLFISGQAKRSTLMGATNLRTRGTQEVDIIPIVRRITKDYARAMDGENVLRFASMFIDVARDRRPGPCWLDIPMDVQAEEV